MNPYFKPLDYKLLSQKTVYKGKRITVEELEYYNPRDDKQVHREHVLAGDAAVILAITEEDEVIMIQEPRTPINLTVLAMPAGQIEKGEQAEVGAIRELEEETGYLAGKMKKLREYFTSVGYTNEKISLFLATDLKKTQRHLDATEDIQVIKIPMKELKEMLDKNEIITASATIALMHYFLYEKGEKNKDISR
ncbi:MAG: NUDIX hydrolase [Clostridia bacterium]